MSDHDIKFKMDSMLQNNPANADRSENEAEAQDEHYPSGGNTRNICFVLLDGRKRFLNYGYLIDVDMPDDETITMSFTNITVKLKGVGLEKLFFDLMTQVPRLIVCKDDRYNDNKENEMIVNEINFTEPS